jgi:hypothetical protein
MPYHTVESDVLRELSGDRIAASTGRGASPQ